MTKKLLAGACSDAGGGGVGESAKAEVIKVGRAIEDGMREYLISTCSLHGLQLTLSNPIIKCCGEGGLQKCTVLQLLHTA